MYDRHKAPGYYGAPHGGGHRGVDGRRFTAPEECAAQFPSVTEKDAMFFIRLWIAYMRFRNFDSALYQPQVGNEEKQ